MKTKKLLYTHTVINGSILQWAHQGLAIFPSASQRSPKKKSGDKSTSSFQIKNSNFQISALLPVELDFEQYFSSLCGIYHDFFPNYRHKVDGFVIVILTKLLLIRDFT